jgi:CRISPR-associated protein Csb1
MTPKLVCEKFSQAQRVYITAELECRNADRVRLQPTGFPDIGPLLYGDPTGSGQVCLVESEASMANRLEEACLGDKYLGSVRQEPFKGLPYIRVEDGKGAFLTASTIEGHRFASEYIMKAKGRIRGSEEETLVECVKRELGVEPGDKKGERVPAGNVPKIFEIAFELDPMSLVHGFQISLKDQLTFVGLRSPRALTGCIVGRQCELVAVPGVKFDPIRTGAAGQAIFRKERITAGNIEASFVINTGLLRSLPLSGEEKQKKARQDLLIAICAWKVAALLRGLEDGMLLRTECDLGLKTERKPQYRIGWGDGDSDFDYLSIASWKDFGELFADSYPKPSKGRSPLLLQNASATKKPQSEKESDKPTA